MRLSHLIASAAFVLIIAGALSIIGATAISDTNPETATPAASPAPISNAPSSASGSDMGTTVSQNANDLGSSIEKALKEGKKPVGWLKGAPQPKLLGRDIGEAVRTDFFNFFHLTPVDADDGGDASRTAVFKPSAPEFKPLVTVRVSLDAHRCIEGIQLEIARSFLDGGLPNSIFARDIVRSFLIATLPKPDDNTMGDLIREIDWRRPKTVEIIASKEKEPKLPALPSPAFKVFAGETEHFQQTLSASSLEIQNTGGAAAQRVLRIATTARTAERAP